MKPKTKRNMKEALIHMSLALLALLIVGITGAGLYVILWLIENIHWLFAFLFPFYLWFIIWLFMEVFID